LYLNVTLIISERRLFSRNSFFIGVNYKQKGMDFLMRRLIFLFIVFLALIVHAQSPVQSSIIMRHEDSVSGAYWSADDNKVLSWSSAFHDSTVRFWDLAAGTYSSRGDFWERGKYDFTGIHDVGWSPDEQHYWVSVEPVHTCYPSCGYQVWVDGQMLADFNNRALWNADSRRLLTWMYHNLPVEDTQPLRVYDTQSRELIGSLSHIQGVQEAVWSSDGESVLYLAYRFNENADYGQYFVGRWIPSDAEPIEEIALPEKDGYWVSWRPADTLQDSLIMIYPRNAYDRINCERHYCLLSVKFAGQDEFVSFTGDALGGNPADVNLSPSGNQLIAINIEIDMDNCGYYCTVTSLWKREAPNAPIHLDMEASSTEAVVWSSDESRFLVWYVDDELNHCNDSYCDATLKLINTDGETELLLPQANEAVKFLDWNRAGNEFIYASNYAGYCEENCLSEIQWIDAETGESRVHLTYDEQIWQIEWREESNQLAVAVGRLIYLYDLAHPETPLTLDGHTRGRISFIWREGELLSWSNDATLRYWDLSGNTEPYEMGDMLYRIEEHPEEGYTAYQFHRSSVDGFAFNEDESKLLSWSWSDSSVAVWDMNGDAEPLIINHFPNDGYSRFEDVFWLDKTHFLTNGFGTQIWDIDPNASFYDPEVISYDEYRVLYQGMRYLPVMMEYGSGLLGYESLIDDLPDIQIEHGGSSAVSSHLFEQHDWLMSSNGENTKLWDIQEPSNPVLLAELPYAIALSPYSSLPLTSDERFLLWLDGGLHVVELPSLEEVYTLETPNASLDAMWDENGERLFLSLDELDCESCRHELLVVYPFEDRQPLVLTHERNIQFFRYFPADDYLMTVESQENEDTSLIRIWNSQTGEELRQIPVNTRIRDIRWEAGKLIGQPLRAFDLLVFDEIWDESPVVLESRQAISAIALSSDGQKLVVGGGDYMYSDSIAEFRIWDLEQLQETARN
jgi:WD40 repeat protein